MNGDFGALLNGGLIRAGRGASAIVADGTAFGTVVVNAGIFDGKVRILAGPDARFENSGWLGMSGRGAGDTQEMVGTFAQTEDGVLVLRVKGARNDWLDVFGPTRLAGTVVPVFKPGGGYLRRYRLVSATEVTGEFDRLVTPGLPAFFRTSLDYTSSDVYLDLKARLGKVDGLTRNERAIGRAFDHAFNTGGAIPAKIDAALFSLSEDDLPQALDAHSGEIFASVQSVLTGQGLFFREAMLGRLRQPGGADAAGADLALGYAATSASPADAAIFAPDPSMWAQGLGAWGNIDGDGNASDIGTDFGGIVGGVDVAVSDAWTAGVALGYAWSHASIDDPDSAADVETGLIGAYLGGELGAWRVRGGGGYSFNAVDTTRSVTYPGYSETTRASYDAGLAQVFGEIAYAAEIGRVAAEPFAGIAWSHLHTDGFTEKGGSAALAAEPGSTSAGFTTVGLRLASTWVVADGLVVVPRASVAWQYAFGGLTPEASLAFADASDIAFTVAGAPIAQNAALIDAGLDFRIGPGARLGLSYFGLLSADAQQNAVRGNLAWAF